MVSIPITGTSKRRSWFGFETLIATAPPPLSAPPRRIVSFVPSNPSTARTVPFFTTIVCPISSDAIRFAISQPKSISDLSRRDNFGPAITPFDAKNCSRKVVAGKRATPILSSSTAIALKIDSAFRRFSFASNKRARQSGWRSKRFRGAIWPAMMAWRTPDLRKTERSRFNSPTRSQSIWSTSFPIFGSVSPLNATALILVTPADRAAFARTCG